MKTAYKKCISLLLAWALFAPSFVLAAYASSGAGDGSGDGSGGAAGLRLMETSLVDGQIGSEETLTLTFSNNVINVSVRENNATAFALYDADDNEVPIDVDMADEQINPDAKRLISVKPQSPLQPGAQYTLVVKKHLQAKNGGYVEGDIPVVFSVVGGPPTLVQSASATATTGQGGGMRLNTMSAVMFVCAGIAVCVLVGFLRLKKKAVSD